MFGSTRFAITGVSRQCVPHRVVAAMCLVHDARSAGPTAKSSYFPLPTIVADTGSANGTSGSRSPSFRNRNMSSAVSPRSGCYRTRLARSSSILMASTPPRPWGNSCFNGLRDEGIAWCPAVCSVLPVRQPSRAHLTGGVQIRLCHCPSRWIGTVSGSRSGPVSRKKCSNSWMNLSNTDSIGNY